MDQYDGDFRARELKLEEDKFAYVRTNDRKQRRATVWTIVLSMLALGGSFAISGWQLAANQRQFDRTSRATYYSDIVNGLGSDSVAVQTNSMLLLVQFVQDRRNYDGDSERQRIAAHDGIQVLTAFIQDLSTPTSKGLPDYLSPQPVVISRAMAQLGKLTANGDLGANPADISRANLHGVYLRYFRSRGPLSAVAADFRRADLLRLRLLSGGNELRRAYFTCANLNDAQLSDANLQYADLSGADLRGADLGRTRNLSAVQLTGATIDTKTVLPPGVTLVGKPWGSGSRRCVALVNKMTGMIAGQGYDQDLPCPLSTQAWAAADAHKRFFGNADDLVAACKMRA